MQAGHTNAGWSHLCRLVTLMQAGFPVRPRWRCAHKDLAWDYPGVAVTVNSLPYPYFRAYAGRVRAGVRAYAGRVRAGVRAHAGLGSGYMQWCTGSQWCAGFELCSTMGCTSPGILVAQIILLDNTLYCIYLYLRYSKNKLQIVKCICIVISGILVLFISLLILFNTNTGQPTLYVYPHPAAPASAPWLYRFMLSSQVT